MTTVANGRIFNLKVGKARSFWPRVCGLGMVVLLAFSVQTPVRHDRVHP